MIEFEFEKEFKRLAKYFSRKTNDEMMDLWYTRLQFYTTNQVRTAFEDMMAGERSFPTLKMVSGYLSTRYRAINQAGQGDDVQPLQVTDAERAFNLDAVPKLIDLMTKKIKLDTYLASLKFLAKQHGVELPWDEFEARGFQLPWRPKPGEGELL